MIIFKDPLCTFVAKFGITRRSTITQLTLCTNVTGTDNIIITSGNILSTIVIIGALNLFVTVDWILTFISYWLSILVPRGTLVIEVVWAFSFIWRSIAFCSNFALADYFVGFFVVAGIVLVTEFIFELTSLASRVSILSPICTCKACISMKIATTRFIYTLLSKFSSAKNIICNSIFGILIIAVRWMLTPQLSIASKIWIDNPISALILIILITIITITTIDTDITTIADSFVRIRRSSTLTIQYTFVTHRYNRSRSIIN